MLDNGVHPLHSSCMDIYTCLSSAWRIHARGNKHNPKLAASAYARGALYTLILAHGLQEVQKSGQAQKHDGNRQQSCPVTLHRC